LAGAKKGDLMKYYPDSQEEAWEDDMAHQDWIRETYGRPEDHVFRDELYEDEIQDQKNIDKADLEHQQWENFIQVWVAIAVMADPDYLPF